MQGLNSSYEVKAMIRQLSLTLVLTFLLISILTGCTGDVDNTTFAPPTFEGVGELPLEVTVDQIIAEYIANEAAADAKYKGERLLFYGVTVEEMGRMIDINEGLFMYNTHLITGGVKFTPKYTDYIDNVGAGFVVDIVGECRGMISLVGSEPLLEINDCWINTIEGGILEDWYPDY